MILLYVGHVCWRKEHCGAIYEISTSTRYFLVFCSGLRVKYGRGAVFWTIAAWCVKLN